MSHIQTARRRSFNTIRFFVFAIFSLPPLLTHAQTELAKLKSLSIEELMNLEVTSVARGPQRLNSVASAIQVITREAILRSGATNIPEALRLATNLQVAQLNSSAWIISARGFNTVFANKLLVLIDGRSVYTPLFGGVLWEMQSVLLEDVDRIEVISGPGGTMWGANAVNGVINIITRKAKETTGTYVSVSAGPSFLSKDDDAEGKAFSSPNFLRRSFSARHGGKFNDKTFYRVYAQHTFRNETFLNDTLRNADQWGITQAGFQLGFYPDENNSVTVQGDLFKGVRDPKNADADFDGQNVLVRWAKTINERSDFVLQAYYDRYWRDDPAATADQMVTYDIDFQHRFKASDINHLLWGIGYRHVEDLIYNRGPIGLLPSYRFMPLYTAFVQNETDLSSIFKLTIGSKFQHNVFSGSEFQPSVRISAAVDKQNTVWAAVSQAVRTPSRMDVDYQLFLPPNPVIVSGDPDNFVSEKLHAYEAGYRVQPGQHMSLSIAGFYNEYRDVYSVEAIADGTLRIMNGSEAETWGGEFSGFYELLRGWRLRAGFTYFGKDIRPKAGRAHDPSYLTNDVKHQALLHSMFSLNEHIEFDVVARYLDYIPASFATVAVPEYFTFDVRLAYQYKMLEVALIGQNLASERHAEFGAIQIPRSFFGKVACRF